MFPVSPCEAHAFQVVPALPDIGQAAAGVLWVTLLLDGDEAAVARPSQDVADRGIVDDTPSDGTHHALSAGLEEPDALAHDAVEDGPVDVLEVDVLGALGVPLERRDRVDPGVPQVARIEAEPGHIGRHVRHGTRDLVLELDVAAGMGVDHRPHSVLRRHIGDGANVAHHRVPGAIREPRRPLGMTGGVVALLMAPVRHRQVRRRVPLPRHRRRLRQARDEGTDLAGLAHQRSAVLRRHEVIEDCAGDDREAARLQCLRHDVEV